MGIPTITVLVLFMGGVQLAASVCSASTSAGSTTRSTAGRIVDRAVTFWCASRWTRRSGERSPAARVRICRGSADERARLHRETSRIDGAPAEPDFSVPRFSGSSGRARPGAVRRPAVHQRPTSDSTRHHQLPRRYGAIETFDQHLPGAPYSVGRALPTLELEWHRRAPGIEAARPSGLHDYRIELAGIDGRGVSGRKFLAS